MINRIPITIDERGSVSKDITILAMENENLSKTLSIMLPNSIQDKWLYVEFEKADGEKFVSPRLEAVNGYLAYSLGIDLLDQIGKLICQVVAKNESGVVWKSNKFDFTISSSINATEEVATASVDVLTDLQSQVDTNANALVDLQDQIDHLEAGEGADLTNYYNKADVDSLLSDKQDKLQCVTETDTQFSIVAPEDVNGAITLKSQREAGDNGIAVTRTDIQFDNMDWEAGKGVNGNITTTAINAYIRDMGSPEEPSEKNINIEANVSNDAHFYADVFDMAKNSNSRVHVAADRAHLMSGNSDFKVTPTQTTLTTPEFLLNGNQVATLADIQGGGSVDLSEYYTKTEVDSTFLKNNGAIYVNPNATEQAIRIPQDNEIMLTRNINDLMTEFYMNGGTPDINISARDMANGKDAGIYIDGNSSRVFLNVAAVIDDTGKSSFVELSPTEFTYNGKQIATLDDIQSSGSAFPSTIETTTDTSVTLEPYKYKVINLTSNSLTLTFSDVTEGYKVYQFEIGLDRVAPTFKITNSEIELPEGFVLEKYNRYLCEVINNKFSIRGIYNNYPYKWVFGLYTSSDYTMSYNFKEDLTCVQTISGATTEGTYEINESDTATTISVTLSDETFLLFTKNDDGTITTNGVVYTKLS